MQVGTSQTRFNENELAEPKARRCPPRVHDGPRISLTSLFSGCGGLDLGFHQEGFRTEAAYDIDPSAVIAFNNNLGFGARVADLSCERPPLGNPQVLLAGSPCQGFSTAGRRDPADPRNPLVMTAARAALEAAARVLIIENVPAALSGAQGVIWRDAEDMLRWHGYQVRRIVIAGEESGIAQRRRRLFMLCWLGSDCIRVEPDTVDRIDLAEALAGVELAADHDPNPLALGSREQRIARRIPPGSKLCNVRISDRAVPTWAIPEVFGATTEAQRALLEKIVRLRRRARRRDFGDADPVLEATLADEFGRDISSDVEALIEAGYLRRTQEFIDLTHTYNGKFRRLRWDDLSPTVDTHFGQAALFLHPDQDRALTAREAARIQGFPDSFAFEGSRTQRFRLIGNAVPPPMAARIAYFVRQALL